VSGVAAVLRAGTALRLATAAALVALATGCAQAPKSPPAEAGAAFWSGRLALQVEADPPQYSSASFELKGSAERGELSLFTPLGGTLAVMAWSPGSATLRDSSQQTRNFASLDALVAEATGTPVPVAALFDWLAGQATAVPGWQPDLSQLASGRLTARRSAPLPPVQLRVILER
jgi:outer membrane lipoprotein LolB